jgi:hypothetical protein
MSKAINPMHQHLSFNEWQQYLYRVRQRNYLRQINRPIPDHLKEENDLIDIERD